VHTARSTHTRADEERATNDRSDTERSVQQAGTKFMDRQYWCTFNHDVNTLAVHCLRRCDHLNRCSRSVRADLRVG
jgi:hypothetical protein